MNLGTGSEACRFVVSHLKESALTWWRSYALEHKNVFSSLTLDVLLHELEMQFSEVDKTDKLRSKILRVH